MADGRTDTADAAADVAGGDVGGDAGGRGGVPLLRSALMAGVDLSPGAAPPVVPACLVGAAVACRGRLPAQTQSGVGLLAGELCDSPGQWMGSLLQIC